MIEKDRSRGRCLVSTASAVIPFIAVYFSSIMFEGRGVTSTWLAPVAFASTGTFLVFTLPFIVSGEHRQSDELLRKYLSNAFYVLYPGILSSALVAILAAPVDSGRLLVWFSVMVFGNDSMAWAGGMLFGRHKGIFKVSPNKSLEGFIFGLLASVGASLAGPLIYPAAAGTKPAVLVLIGIVTGIAVVSGDLFESALKRAAGVKDSGVIIPGRGGMLDSFDSLLFAAPVFAASMTALGLLS